MDFSLKIYRELLESLISGGFEFLEVKRYQEAREGKKIMLRQDVDARPLNSLAFAKIQAELKIASTFYFRTGERGFTSQIIRETAGLGHEIGYHYETMDTCRGNAEKAYDEFCRNLDQLRLIAPVVTACMHGSPMSKFDNRAIWEKYDYKKLGILAEPYFDLDFTKLVYLTDTGRRWDGFKVSVRDKQQNTINPEWPSYRTTGSMISAIRSEEFPRQLMMTFHPQRWTDNSILWIKELISQNIKNQVKRYFFVKDQTFLEKTNRNE